MYAKKALKNTIYNVMSLVLNSVLTFIVRTVFIRYLGNEILGINATIIDTVNLFTMSEMGIQTAIIYKLYKPINEGDIERQKILFNLYKNAYRIVAIAIFIVGIVFAPFLRNIVKTTVSYSIVYEAYFLQLILIVCTYLVSYYKILLLANQRQYVYTGFEIIVNILISIIKILAIVKFESYILYLCTGYIALIFNTLYIVRKTRADYREAIVRCNVPRKDIKEMFSDLKKMILITISGYVYGSTDSILISYFFGSIWVGMISNYKMVTNIMRNFIVSYVASAVAPSWGNFLQSEPSEEKIWDNFSVFIFIEFILGVLFLLPTWLLIEDFILIWLVDTSYIIDDWIVALIILDIFLTSLNEPTAVLIRNRGLFSEENIASLLAMIGNIGLSVILAKKIGLMGIFIGTLIAVCIYCIVGFWYVNKMCFSSNKKYLFSYFRDYVIYLAFFVISFILFDYLYGFIFVEISIKNFILKGLLTEIILCVVIMMLWWRTGKISRILKIIKR